jgi:hypothetical protein
MADVAFPQTKHLSTSAMENTKVTELPLKKI